MKINGGGLTIKGGIPIDLPAPAKLVEGGVYGNLYGDIQSNSSYSKTLDVTRTYLPPIYWPGGQIDGCRVSVSTIGWLRARLFAFNALAVGEPLNDVTADIEITATGAALIGLDPVTVPAGWVQLGLMGVAGQTSATLHLDTSIGGATVGSNGFLLTRLGAPALREFMPDVLGDIADLVGGEAYGTATGSRNFAGMGLRKGAGA